MRAFLQPISARIYFGKTASHRKSARFVQSRGALPQAYWMSVKAAQRRGCAKRAFCGVCFLMPGGLTGVLFCIRDVGAMWASPLRVICRTLCRAGPACPAGINAYCAAGHMGPALRIILRPLRCRASPTGGRRGGRPCPPRVTAHFPPGRCGHRPLRIHPPVMRCRGRRPRRPASAKRCHSEPVTVSLAWESVPLVPYLLTTSRPSDQTETMLCRCVM